MQFLILKLINFYQTFLSFDRGLLMVLAPGGACRYEISCAEYTKKQVMERGVLKGLAAGVRRIISCR